MLKENVNDGRSSNMLLANCLKLRCTQRQTLIAHVHQFMYVHIHVMHRYMHIYIQGVSSLRSLPPLGGIILFKTHEQQLTIAHTYVRACAYSF